MGIAELASELGMPKSTLHHIITTLVETGFLSQDPLSRTYNIGFHLVGIGQAYLEQLDLRKIARPHLERLSMKVKEIVHLLVLDEKEVVYIDKVENHVQEGTLRCSSFIGRRVSAYSTAAGKVLLAFYRKGFGLICRRKNFSRKPSIPSPPRALWNNWRQLKEELR